MIPNKVIKTVYSSYYLSLYREFNLNLVDEQEYNSINEIRENGDIKRFVEYVSMILKKADNRIYINFKEKDLQILMYAILIKYQKLDVELEYKSYNKFIDMYIKTSKYNIIVELKYLKKKESDKYDEVLSDANIQIGDYSKVFHKDNLKKYVVVFIGSDYTIDEVE